MSHPQLFDATFPRPAAISPQRIPDVEAIVGCSAALRETLDRVRRVAPTDAMVLITGETGTGKELLARAVHRQSRRASRSFVTSHLAAVPEALIASELFGHERGAFTGADRLRIGRFEAADGSTLFLDEVGELSPDMQVALLRALQEGTFERIGTTVTRRVDVRVVAATNQDLEDMMEQGRFRPDLFYRLSVFPIHVPSLRERRDDIPALAHHFLQQSSSRLGRAFSSIEPASLARLTAFDWPGNIRQLQNIIEQSAILGDEGELRVPPSLLAGHQPRPGSELMFADAPTLEEIKKRYIRHVIGVTRGNMSRAATILNVDRRSLYRMMDRHSIPLPRRLHDDRPAVATGP